MLSSNGLPLPVIVGIVSGVALILVMFLVSSQFDSNYSVADLIAEPNVLKAKYVKTIVGGEFIFRPGDAYKPFLFIVPEDAANARLDGEFEVRGTTSSVSAIIMPLKEYLKWRTGEPVSYYYNSDIVASSRFNQSLPSGQSYYIVIDNSFSVNQTKFVQLTARLSYDH